MRSFTFILAFFLMIAASIIPAEARMKIIDVTKFGAVPSDGKSDMSAVLAALDECKKHTSACLKFPKGTYNFAAGDNPQNKSTLIPLQGYKKFVVDGQGSEFIIKGNTQVFSIYECSDVTIKGISIDFERPPFSPGKVVAVGDQHFDVDIPEEYPVSGGEPVGAYMDYDPATKLYVRHGLDEYYTVVSTELVRPQILRVKLKNKARVKVGSWVLLRHQVYGPCTIYAGRSENVTINNVNVYTVPGMGFIGQRCKNITLDKFNVMPRPGSGRLMSATADAVHLSGNTGTIAIKNCTFEGMGDDAVNCKTGLYLAVKKQEDEKTVLAAHNLKILDPPDTGDVIELTDPVTLLSFGTASVKSCETLPNDGLQRIVFTEPLPREIKEGTLLGNATRIAKVRISNCTVRNNRARGFLIQNRDVVVEGCKFENCTSGGIWVLTECWYFYESIGSRDVIIRKNTFDNCNYGGPLGEAVLGVYAVTGPGKYAPEPGVHKNVLIEKNIVRTADNSALIIAGADGVTIRGNVFENIARMPTHPCGKSAVWITNSANVHLEKNTIDLKKQGEAFKESVTLGPGCQAVESKP